MSTKFPVCTDSQQWTVEGVGMGMAPKLREGKAAPTGEATYASGCILRVSRKDGELAVDKSASLHVLEPAAVYELGVLYRAEGRVYVQPFMTGSGDSSRIAYSITCQRLVPAQAARATKGGE